jgi:hypothetical protein
MDKEQLFKNLATGIGKATVWTARKAGEATTKAAEFVYDHREEIAKGGCIAANAAAASIKGAATFVYDTASLKLFSREKLDTVKARIEAQGKEYRSLVDQHGDGFRVADSLMVGGDLLFHILATGVVSADVDAAYSAAYPDLAARMSFDAVVKSLHDSQITGFVSGVKGKLFEMRYLDYLNDGNLPDGYHAELATSATQPGWDIAVHGPDGHVASLLQMKATDSVEYVKHALERYPDIDVVTTDEVYSQLVMNGAADHVASSGISDVALTHNVLDATDAGHIQMHWTPPVISLALIAFTAYTLKDATEYEKARSFGTRAGKSYLSYLVGGSVAAITQTWWLGLLAGIGSRYLAGRGRSQREAYQELLRIAEVNDRVLAQYQELISQHPRLITNR